MSDPTRLNDRDLDRLDIDEIRQFLARRWNVILATAVGCVIIAALVCVMVAPVYTATSQVLLDPRKQHVFGTETVNPDSVLDSSIVDSQIPIILSNRLLAKVIAKENLADDPEFAASGQPGLLDRLFGMFRGPREANVEAPSLDGIDPKLGPVILHLFNKVDVARVAKSYVLSISVSSRDAAKAMRIANTIAETYVEDQIDVHSKSVQQTATFFEQRLGSLREQVRQSESAVAEFRKAHDLTTTSMDGKITVGEQQLQSLNEELAKISADTAEKLARYQQAIRFNASGIKLDTLPEIIRSPVITQLRGQQADLTRREADLAAMYGPAYPALTQIRAQRAGLDRAIGMEMKRLTATLTNDYEVAKAREDAFRKTIVGLSNVSGGDNEVGVKLRELERTNLANKALFENFLNRAKLTQEQSTFEEPNARLISPALEPSSPSSPKIKLILPVAGVVGLLLGLGLAALFDVRRRPATAVRPARAKAAPIEPAPSKVSAPPAHGSAFILGRVPHTRRLSGHVDPVAFVDRHPGSPFVLSIDALASKVMTGMAGEGRILTLSPLSSGEGATTLAICLAEAVGRAGKRVLLIDADPARQGLSILSAATDRPGLAEVIDGGVSASKAVLRRPHFALLPIGQEPLALAAAGKAFRAFLKETRGRFDLVLIDTPAFDAGPDAMSIAALADGFAIVASWDQLLRETFISVVDTVADKPGFAGIILNRTAGAEEQGLALTG